MGDWKAKRFWTEATPAETAGQFEILLDGRVLKTPAKTALRLPTVGIAEAIAAEWNAVEDRIDPAIMPFTRLANAALDKVPAERGGIISHLAEYAETELICYRAEAPRTLVQRQADAWNPWLDWAREALDLPLLPVFGVIHHPQNAQGRAAAILEALDDFALMAAHDLIGVSGSYVLGMACLRGALTAQECWALCQLDEAFQAEQWGSDSEADSIAEHKAHYLRAVQQFGQLVATQTP